MEDKIQQLKIEDGNTPIKFQNFFDIVDDVKMKKATLKVLIKSSNMVIIHYIDIIKREN